MGGGRKLRLIERPILPVPEVAVLYHYLTRITFIHAQLDEATTEVRPMPDLRTSAAAGAPRVFTSKCVKDF